MRIVPFSSLNQLDISITALSVCMPKWSADSEIRHLISPRTTNLLFYLKQGNWTYYMDSQAVLTLQPGDILFLPVGCKYLSRFVQTSDEICTGICIDFSILDENLVELALGDSPQLLFQDTHGTYYSLFRQALDAYLVGSGGTLSSKAVVYRLLDELVVQMRQNRFASSEYSSIYPALLCVERHPEENKSIPELASMCYLSESNFRRLFRNCTGLSPVAYRNQIRIQKADELLRSGLYTVESAAELLGFNDSSHFCKTYRKLRGQTPTGRKPIVNE